MAASYSLIPHRLQAGALSDQAAAASLKTIDALLKDGASVNSKSLWTDMTPIMVASFFDFPAAVKRLLAHNKKPSLTHKCSSMENATALHLAVMAGSVESVKLLLNAGMYYCSCSLLPDVYARRSDQRTGRAPPQSAGRRQGHESCRQLRSWCVVLILTFVCSLTLLTCHSRLG